MRSGDGVLLILQDHPREWKTGKGGSALTVDVTAHERKPSTARTNHGTRIRADTPLRSRSARIGPVFELWLRELAPSRDHSKHRRARDRASLVRQCACYVMQSKSHRLVIPATPPRIVRRGPGLHIIS